MRRLFSSTGTAALVAFLIWFTIIFSRTHAFAELWHDGARAFAILGGAVAMAVFGGCMHRIFFTEFD